MRVETIGDANLYQGNCIDVMRGMADASIDSVVCDPPYELGFMGKAWDASGIANSVAMWTEALRVLKPGGHLLAFSGSRTYHRMVCAIEDAGFEIRDQIMWVYSSGFPKSKNLDGKWDGWGTALKPSHEPICVARKTLVGTVAANMQQFGTGAINIDGCRVDAQGEKFGGGEVAAGKNAVYGSFDGYTQGPHKDGHALGRWPANLIHDGSNEVMAAFPQALGFDASSAARFFYCAKASKMDRSEGNTHPTVKPTDLMRYLCRLVTPPAGLVLDPFMGSGSTGTAALREGFRFVGIDLSQEYFEIACGRIEQANTQGQLFAPEQPKPEQLGLEAA